MALFQRVVVFVLRAQTCTVACAVKQIQKWVVQQVGEMKRGWRWKRHPVIRRRTQERTTAASATAATTAATTAAGAARAAGTAETAKTAETTGPAGPATSEGTAAWATFQELPCLRWMRTTMCFGWGM